MNEWISSKDKFPEVGQRVLVYTYSVRIGHRREKEPHQRGGLWSINGTYYNDDAVTHWMPLPEPPNE